MLPNVHFWLVESFFLPVGRDQASLYHLLSHLPLTFPALSRWLVAAIPLPIRELFCNPQDVIFLQSDCSLPFCLCGKHFPDSHVYSPASNLSAMKSNIGDKSRLFLTYHKGYTIKCAHHHSLRSTLQGPYSSHHPHKPTVLIHVQVFMTSRSKLSVSFLTPLHCGTQARS